MNTTEMTPAALNESIAIQRGWNFWTRWTDADGYEHDDYPDFTGDIREAMSLLRELPKAWISYGDTKVAITWLGAGGLVSAEIGKEAQAISAAWWQFKTGVIVEILG